MIIIVRGIGHHFVNRELRPTKCALAPPQKRNRLSREFNGLNEFDRNDREFFSRVLG